MDSNPLDSRLNAYQDAEINNDGLGQEGFLIEEGHLVKNGGQ